MVGFLFMTDPTYDWTYGYSFTPNTNLQVIAVRTYSGTKVSIWTETGTLLAEQNVTSPPRTWTETPLTTPITLSAGTTYRLSVYQPMGTTNYYAYYGNWPTTFANGTVGQNYYYAYSDGFPYNPFDATGIGPLIDLHYTASFSNSIPVSPTSSGAFVNGVWSGNITVSQGTSNVVLKASDSAGHTAFSTPFNLFARLALLSPKRLTGGQFQFTVVSPPGQRLAILASSNLLSWTTNATFTNTTGTTNFTDPTTGLSKRFYRARGM